MSQQSSHGGRRPGAGRPRESNQRKSVSVYLTASDVERIRSTSIQNCGTLSKKCRYLIDLGIESIERKHMNIEGRVSYIDLFAGMGGLRLGLEAALKERGVEGVCVFSSEIKPAAIKVYKNNFAEDPTCDITKIDPSGLPDFDILLAGFPCQAFSQAGLGLGFHDTRGTLFFNIASILKEKSPKGFILENVEGLLNHDKGKTIKVILDVLSELGYSVVYRVLDGQDFGLAQSRRRIYILGTKEGIVPTLEDFASVHSILADVIDDSVPPESSELANKLLEKYSLEDLYGKALKDKRGGKNNIHSWDIALKGKVSNEQARLLEALLKQRRNKHWAEEIGIDWMDGMPLSAEMISRFFPAENLQELLDDLVDKGYLVLDHPRRLEHGRRVPAKELPKGYNIVAGKLSFRFTKILDPRTVTPTIVATDVHKMAVPVSGGLRSLTPKEGLRLFGYPASYSLKGLKENEAFDLLGNTVCVPVIQAVAGRLLDVWIEG